MAWFKCTVNNQHDGISFYKSGELYEFPSNPNASYFTAVIDATVDNVTIDQLTLPAHRDVQKDYHISVPLQFEEDVTFENDIFFDNITGGAGIQKFVAWNGGTGVVDVTTPALVKTGDTEFTVEAGTANFLDLSDPINPTLAHVSWNQQTGITDTYAATNLRTWVTVDSSGTITLFADEVTAAERRDYAVIGVLTHTDGSTITQVNTIPDLSIGTVDRLTDLCTAVKFVNLSGNVYSGASSSVNSLAVTAGSTFACGRNYATDKESPNVNSQAADSNISSFFVGYSDGAGGATVTTASVVDSTKYDDLSGTPATLPDGHWVTHRIFRSSAPSGSTLLVYGQATHKGRVEALTQIVTENFDQPPGAEELVLRGYLTIKKGAAGLQDTATSVFTPANKFGTTPANRPTNGFSVGVPIYKSESFTSRGVGAGTFYLFGRYRAPATDVALTQASTTQAYGTANAAYGMRPFAVFAGNGTVDTGQVGLRVTGTTITDGGVRTASDTQVITTDITSPALNEYIETTKKFIGQVTYQLYTVSGSPTTYSVSFNYGLVKYEDFGNRDFMLTDLEVSWIAGATDTGVNIVIKKHAPTGWTYSAAAFAPGNGNITSLNTIYVTEDDIINNEYGFFKIDSTALNAPILGASTEGVIMEITTTQNNTFQILNAHLGVQV